MPSRFEDRFQALAVPKFVREFGVTVRFFRGVNFSEEFMARRNDRINNVIDAEYGAAILITTRDFILPVASVVVDGNEIEPRAGDRITEGDEIFEIQPPDANTPAVELQSGGYEWIVHTTRVE